ncbi:hypothetical protein [Marinomonas shanghaiensis]|uniref:hypothetical protein n=1 Tax=Marinomonas shanghaiensis TaxID=2202418 RepID=UPI003A94BCD1
MDLEDAFNLINRIENLPQIYDEIEKAICSVVHSYFQELLEVEEQEAVIMGKENYERSELTPYLNKKSEIHNKYWSNSAKFYQPCSSSSSPEHIWECLSDIEVLQNGDDENNLYIFKAKSKNPDNGLLTNKAFLLKLEDDKLLIEHEFFG